MNLFMKEPGPQYVPAFAGRLLLAMAKGTARATSDTKRALVAEDVDGMWTLAMVVVQWYADALPPSESKAVTDTLREFDIASIAANLNLFRERLLPFVKTAHEARSDAQLAAAGVYFLAAVEQIGMSLLSSAMNSGAVSALGRKLKSRLPLPDDLKADYYLAIGRPPPASTTRPASSPGTSRGDRFERADFSPRPAGRTATPRSGERSTASSPLAPPSPNLANAEVARAYLSTLGWNGSEVDRLLQGPEAPAGKRRV